MDNKSDDQPTLKRFSRYNQSMHSRPLSMCIFESTSSHIQQPQTYSKGSNTCAATNDREEPAASQTSNYASVKKQFTSTSSTTVESDYFKSSRSASFPNPGPYANEYLCRRERMIPITIKDGYATFSSTAEASMKRALNFQKHTDIVAQRQPTNCSIQRLNAKKAAPLMMDSTKPENHLNENRVFNGEPVCSQVSSERDFTMHSANSPSQNIGEFIGHEANDYWEKKTRSTKYQENSPATIVDQVLTENFATNLVIDADSAYKTDVSDSSPSSFCSNRVDMSASPSRKITQDLCASTSPKNMEAHRICVYGKEKQTDGSWMQKPMNSWILDDVILWLQHCKLESVASIMIGYELSGKDVENWNEQILGKLGVSDAEVRQRILKELENVKFVQRNIHTISNPEQVSKRRKKDFPLFKLVCSTSYDKVVAVQTSLTSRDITVAEGRFGCLQVTKVNGFNIPLKENDCFLEINSKPGQLFRSPLMFTKLVTEASGEPIRFVVLRRRSFVEEDEFEKRDNGNYLQRRLNAADKESSASSGISSNEQYSDGQMVSAEDEDGGDDDITNASLVLRL